MTEDSKNARNEMLDSSGLDLRNELQDEHRTHPRGWFQWLFDQLHPVPGQRILDLGCGTGDFWVENQSRVWEDWYIVMGDRSHQMLREARSAVENTANRFDYLLLDGQSIPLQPAGFDAVLAVGLFDLLPEPERSFAEIHRALRAGGRIYATAGGFTHLQEFEEILQPILGSVRLGGLPDRFGLENGIQRLSPWFDPLQLYRYADQLVFTQVQPVLDYILSEEEVASELQGERLAAVVQRIEQRLNQGAFTVKREKGVIIGERREGILIRKS
jgi:SAM-dependent methyltransferase